MFKNGVDQGYMQDPNWWFNPGPHQFRIADLDKDYPAEYFPLAEPPKEAIQNIVKYVKEYYELITGEELTRVFEFGAGGGWTVKAFRDVGIIAEGIEGSLAGIQACDKLFDDETIVDQADIRQEIFVGSPSYQMAVFCEVAEHAEICFHGMMVHNITNYSDLIWFSSEDPEIVHNRAHLHHPGEMPLRYWQNLFAFYGYGCYMLPDEVFSATEGRGRCIFYNKATYPELK